MAADTRGKPGSSAQADSRTHHRAGATRDPQAQSPTYSPFALMRQGLDEMDRWWNRVAGGAASPGRASASRWNPSAGMPSSVREWMASAGDSGEWAPAIEAFQRGSEFVVRADVPGMTRHDLNVEIGEDALTISGERRSEQQHERDGMFWSERNYGSFCRTIPLPPGAISESAKATFTNGVLEVVIQAPSRDARRGRKIDISGGASSSS